MFCTKGELSKHRLIQRVLFLLLGNRNWNLRPPTERKCVLLALSVMIDIERIFVLRDNSASVFADMNALKNPLLKSMSTRFFHLFQTPIQNKMKQAIKISRIFSLSILGSFLIVLEVEVHATLLCLMWVLRWFATILCLEFPRMSDRSVARTVRIYLLVPLGGYHEWSRVINSKFHTSVS